MPVSPAVPADTYHRLIRLCAPPNVNIADRNTPRTGDPEVSAAELTAHPDAARSLVDGESERLYADHGRRPRRDVAASRLLHHYLWSVCLLFTGPWYLDRRVPHIPLTAVRVTPSTGALTLDTAAVTCAPGDAEALRSTAAAHLGPVLDAFAPHVRRGRRALWGMATDDLASGLWFLGRALGEEERGVREAATLLPGGTPPFPGSAGFRVLHAPSGRAHLTRTRLGCCLYYTVKPDDPCLTCPRLSDPERLRRLEHP